MDTVPRKATDVLTTKQKLPRDGDLHGQGFARIVDNPR